MEPYDKDEMYKILRAKFEPDPNAPDPYAPKLAEADQLNQQSRLANLASGLQKASDKFGSVSGQAVKSDTSAMDAMGSDASRDADSIVKGVQTSKSLDSKNRMDALAEYLKAKRGEQEDSIKQTQFDTKMAFEKEQNEKDRGNRLASAKASADNKQSLAAVANTDKLRNYRDSHDITKKTNAIEQAYQGIQAAAQNPSAAGDLSLIFQYMKILDPGSTVREGEFANAQNATGVPEQVVNMYNRVKSGERLADTQRKDFLSQAGNLRNQQRGIQEQLDKQVRTLAEKRGMSTDDVILDPFADISTSTASNDQKPKGGGFGVSETAYGADDPRNMKAGEIFEYDGKTYKVGPDNKTVTEVK